MNKNRDALYAGRFYEATPKKLLSELKLLFNHCKPCSTTNIIAVISPHAGYMFSGKTAASAINQFNSKKKYHNIFVIAPSHHYHGNGIAIFSEGNYETPLGEIPINTEIQNFLLNNYPSLFYINNDAHYKEHSLEVQLPFVQYKIKHFQYLVPLIVTTHNLNKLEKIATVLKPYFNSNNLFIISTDWSHYPNAIDAEKVDRETIDAVLSKDIDRLTSLLEETEHVYNLHTRMCGSNAVILLLFLANSNKYHFNLIEYTNSSFSIYGDHKRVVGYAAIAIEEKDFSFTEDEQKEIIKIARSTLNSYLYTGEIPSVDTSSENLNKKYGVFVSIYKNDQLRGCLGKLTTHKPLYESIQELTISAATRDFRFDPIDVDEVKDVVIEISILSDLKKINDIHEIELGKHGIYIKKGNLSGTYLPQVATKTGWTLEEFLGHCAEDKVGIGWNGWKYADIYTYETFIIRETNYTE